MGHSITALVISDSYDAKAAQDWDVVPVPLGDRLHLMYLNHYYTAYMQARRGEVDKLDVPADFPMLFPREAVIRTLAAALTDASGRGEAPTFALVMTDYWAGIGGQWAYAVVEGQRVPVDDINGALRALGIRAVGELDEFDTVALGHHRTPPDYLDRYEDLFDDLRI